MLYYLLYPLRDVVPAFNVFRYITFRVAAAVVTALLLSWLFGPWFIRTLRRLSVGQNIRDVGPQAHQVKAGTPTMGGLLILFAVLVPTLLWGALDNPLRLAGDAGHPRLRRDRLRRRLHHAEEAAQSRSHRAHQVPAAGGGGDGVRPGAALPARWRRLQSDARLPLHQAAGAAPGLSLHPLRGSGPGGGLERGESDGRARRSGHRRHDGGRRYLRCLHLHRRQPGDRQLPPDLLRGRGGRGGGLLRRPGRRRPRLPLVQLASGRGLHGRRRLAVAGRGHRLRRRARQAGDPAGRRRRPLRAGRRCRSSSRWPRSSCGASGCSAWLRSTTTSSSRAGRSRRSSCASGSCRSCSRSSPSPP